MGGHVRRWVERRATPERTLALALTLLAAAVVLFLAVDLFPHHSVNDDEGVYLTQAALLLEGQLGFHPGSLGDAVRPWFFVEESTGGDPTYYPKYSPVPAAVFALGLLAGEPRVALGLVAAAVAGGVYLLASSAFDRSTGLLAVVLLLASPLFLFTTSVFLPYAPTTVFSLAFAAGYVHAARTGSVRTAGAAGVAVGVAFFSRPYTAVLFAAPFVLHALVTLGCAAREDPAWFREVLRRNVAIGVPGSLGVVTALSYNRVVTGSFTTFPYEAFAPRDGLGFGVRRILGYERTYTPELAFETTVEVLSLFAQWGPAGVIGVALAVVGVGTVLRRWWRSGRRLRPSRSGPTDGEVAALVLGLVPAVVLGNAYFWGQLNGLTNGLFDLLGPFYHYDLLVPLSVFGAAGAVRGWEALRRAVAGRLTTRRARVALALVLVVSVAGSTLVTVDAAADPYAANRERTETLQAVYTPFESTDFDDALVFTPDTYGDWQAHPFQWLRNDPGFDGDVVYATDGSPERDSAVAAATDRRLYRFAYRGDWRGATGSVNPRIVSLRELRGERVAAETVVGVPQNARSASVRIETTADGGDAYGRYLVSPNAVDGGGTIPVQWVITPSGARVTSHEHAGGSAPVPVPDDAGEVDLVVTFVDESGASVSYRQEVTLAVEGGEVVALWPPETRVCRLRTECGMEGTWVGPGGDYVDGVSVETSARVER